MNFSSVFKSNDGNINILKYVDGIGALFAVTENGGINKIRTIPSNAYGMGLTEIFSQILDGDGDLSSISYDYVYYDLYKCIASLLPSSFTVVKENVNAYGLNKKDSIIGVYVSDVLKVDEDFGFWKTVSWKQSLFGGSVTVAFKVANTESELLSSDWQYYVSEESSLYGQVEDMTVSKSLDRFNLKGRYMQFKVVLETTIENISPSVHEFIISYASKTSVLFFTRKFKITKGDNIDNIIITSSYSEPMNTEIRFGVTDSNSSDWRDYKIVNLNELTSLSSSWGNIIKVGIKFSSYTDKSYPVVQDFGMFLGSKTNNKMNGA